LPETTISRERPLIILQTSPRFGDSEDGHVPRGDIFSEATKHGREAVRVWNAAVPDDIKPYCQLQMEVRLHDHQERYQAFQRLFDELQTADVPANIQFADPHDEYVFDPVCVEKLTQEYPCIKSYTITEMRFEYYRTFNVPRYAVPPETLYAMDIIKMAAKYGKHVSVSLQDLKWMHIGADELNQPLVDVVYDHRDYVLAVNEHIGPRHLPRQTSVWGFWIAGAVRHWGVEPQSWWFENGRMITPGVFGQREPDNTRIMPPLLYRAMILQAALLGATVYQFEPFWDLFDYDNSHCWRDVIYPTLMEVIRERLIPSREQVMAKTKVAYQYKLSRNINEFHENMRDVDWISDEGLLAEAAYGLWARYLEHELIPNKGKHFFIPLLPPKTPQAVLDSFERVIQPGTCDSVAAYEALLAQHYPQPDGEGSACIMSINDHVYVMQTHENLYERQSYEIDLPQALRGLAARRVPEGVVLSWDADAGASAYHIHRAELGPDSGPRLPLSLIGDAVETTWCDRTAQPGESYAYGVSATTTTREKVTGYVNYLDYLVFSQRTSRMSGLVAVEADGAVHPVPSEPARDTRPASQVVYPTFDGADGPHKLAAEQIVTRIDQFKAAYEARDWRALTELYSVRYQDPNGYHREYVGRAWKFWLWRYNRTCFLRQIRYWDFGEYERTGAVRVRMFALCRAMRRDDQPFGYGYHGTCRIPRHLDEEVVFTWAREEDMAWRIIATEPALPNFQEMLWNHRGQDQVYYKLRPGKDD
jgi:hypothetical protein